MENSDSWVLNNLQNLKFEPYGEILPKIEKTMLDLRQIETNFIQLVNKSLTKRQAVGFGLLARTFQLCISCLQNQLLQNYAGWNCSYRALLETYFVVDWLKQDSQRYESYFEDKAPGIGKIKSECCGRYPEFARDYQDVSEVTHVGVRSLHLPRNSKLNSEKEFPFSATYMSISGNELADMLQKFQKLSALLVSGLNELLLLNFNITQTGEVLWDSGLAKSKFGCLGWSPRK